MSDGGQRSIEGEIDIPDGRESSSFRGCPRFGVVYVIFRPPLRRIGQAKELRVKCPAFQR